MKKIFILLIGVSLIGSLGSCGEDNEGEALIGVWIGQFQEVSDCVNDPDAVRTSGLRCDDATCYRLVLSADGSFSFQEGLGVENGTYTGNFSSLTLCIDEEGEVQCTTYTVEGNTSATLDISTTNEASGCKTTLFFQKEIIEEETES